MLYPRIGHVLKYPGVQIKGVTSFLKLRVKKVKVMHIAYPAAERQSQKQMRLGYLFLTINVMKP